MKETLRAPLGLNLCLAGLWAFAQAPTAGQPQALPVKATTETTAPAKDWKGLYDEAQALYKQGQYAKGIEVAKHALGALPPGSKTPPMDQARCLTLVAKFHRALGQFLPAEPLYQQSLEIRKKALSADHPEVIEGLWDLGDFFGDKGDHKVAGHAFSEALTTLEQSKGPEHLDLLQPMRMLAWCYKNQSLNDKAETLYLRRLAILKKAYPPEHSEIAKGLDGLGYLYCIKNQYDKALECFQHSRNIREKALGPEHIEVADSLEGLASIAWNKGHTEEVIALYERSLAIKEKALGPEHPDLKFTLDMLANSLQFDSQIYRAKHFSNRALSIRIKAFGPKHPELADSLDRLASMHLRLQQYKQAERLYAQALEIQQSSRGMNHWVVAQCMSNLADVYLAQGQHGKGEYYLHKSLEINEKHYGPQEFHTAFAYLRLVDHYLGTEKLKKAEAYGLKALDIFKKSQGTDIRHLIYGKNTLARVYQAQDRFTEAETLLQECLNHEEQHKGREHTDVATCLAHLAKLYQKKGDKEKAGLYFKRAMENQKKVKEFDNPVISDFTTRFPEVYSITGQSDEARSSIRQAILRDEKRIEQILRFNSEIDALNFIAPCIGNLHNFIALTLQHFSDDPKALKECLDLWLRRKGIVLETQRRFQDSYVESTNQEAKKKLDDFFQTRMQLANRPLHPSTNRRPEEARQALEALQQKVDALEGELRQLSPAYAQKQLLSQVTSEDLAKRLPANTALVEFARIDLPDQKQASKNAKTARYLAFVLQSGRPDDVKLVDLGDAQALDQRLQAYLKTMEDKRWNPKLSRSLYQKVYAPLAKHLQGKAKVFLSPDGSLNLLPFETLMSPKHRFLIESHEFNYLTSGRDLLTFGKPARPCNKAIIMGHPDFDLQNSPSTPIASLKPTLEDSPGFAFTRELRGKAFAPLPETLAEVQAVHRLLGADQAELYTKKSAQEAVLMACQSPKILHLATHGFFFSDQELQVLTKQPYGFENPLQRSGIVLAGANRAIQPLAQASQQANLTGQQAKEDNKRQSQEHQDREPQNKEPQADAEQQDDEVLDCTGIITAEKVLNLNLSGTELVVLSACRTGLGEVKAGEGIFGLRRAFAQAGARSQVMSLWNVPDRETRELMTGFYKNLIEGKQNRNQALRNASLTALKKARQRRTIPSPLYWGGFVFLGEP